MILKKADYSALVKAWKLFLNQESAGVLRSDCSKGVAAEDNNF